MKSNSLKHCLRQKLLHLRLLVVRSARFSGDVVTVLTVCIGITSAKATEAADGPKKVSIVEFKRAYNVSIALAQFKAFPTYTDLLQTVFEVGTCC